MSFGHATRTHYLFLLDALDDCSAVIIDLLIELQDWMIVQGELVVKPIL
ncbi:MAG: hypothetical protein ACYTXC_03395 [Nostoc sp.]